MSSIAGVYVVQMRPGTAFNVFNEPKRRKLLKKKRNVKKTLIIISKKAKLDKWMKGFISRLLKKEEANLYNLN